MYGSCNCLYFVIVKEQILYMKLHVGFIDGNLVLK